MRTHEERIRRLEIWNRVWFGLLVFSVLGFAANSWLNSMRADLRALSIRWQTDGSVQFSSASDGPFVVTHLVKYGNSKREMALARLLQPLAIIESGGATISKGDVAKLVWVNTYGQSVTAPKDGIQIKALYFRPETATQK